MKTLTKITMAVLLITLIISVTLIYAASSPNQNVTTFNSENGVTIRIPENITTMFDRTGTVTPNIWKKFIGETVPDADSVPDIIDYSYAGYKYGAEAIPDIANGAWTVRNAIDYGAIPNDMKSDTEALRRFFSDVPSNTILYIPVGRYDINMKGDSSPYKITVTFNHPNVIVRGDGAEGYKRGGTSIYMHEKPIDSKGKPYYYAASFGFNGNWRDGPRGGQTTVTGFHEAGAMSFTVANGSTFFAGSFIELQQISLFTEDTPENSKIFQFNVGLPHTTTSQYYGSNIANGLPLSEKHQIDRVEGNTIYIKDPLMTPINNNIKVKGIKLMQNIGIEDIHFDFGQNGRYTHHTNADIGHGRQGVGLSNLAHSWIKHVRVTNAMSSVWIRQCYATSAMGILLENVNHVKQAHYGGDVGSASRIFVGLFEEITEIPETGDWDGSFHGFTVNQKAAGTVLWGFGSKLGVDFHGGQPRHNLVDNYRGWDHESSSGGGAPQHLAGYVNWNSESLQTNSFNLQAWGGKFTHAICVGYKDRSNSPPYNGSVESYGSTVNPVSLYVGQLTQRLGYEPAWIQSEISAYNDWRANLLRSTPYIAPTTITSHTAGIHDIVIPPNQSVTQKIGVSIRSVGPPQHPLTFEVIGDDAQYFEIKNVVTKGGNHKVYTADLHVSSQFAQTTRDVLYPVVKIENTSGYSAIQYFRITVFDAPTHVLYGRTSQIQQAVVDALDHRNNVADVTAEDLLTLTRLTAYSKNIEELRVGDFAGMSNLLDLYLSNNDIETVSNDLFTGLDSLKHIYLDGNPLGTVPRDLFSGMTSLELISFWNTGLTTVHKNLFRGLTNLISVRLGHNEIVHIPNTLFPNGSKIIYLDLRRNNLGRIPVNSLNNLNKLQTLQMSENNLGRINADTFNSLTSLRYLHLDNCNLDSIHLGLFDSLRALEILALNNNNIPLLPIGIFKNNRKLRTLDLTHNNLRRMPNDAFKGLVDMKILELEDNKVDPLKFPVSLVKVSDNTFKVSVPYGATFTFDVPLRLTNCTLSSDTVTVSIGKTESPVITVTHENVNRNAKVTLGRLPTPPQNSEVHWQTHIFHAGYSLSPVVKKLTFEEEDDRSGNGIPDIIPFLNNKFSLTKTRL